MKLKYDKEIQEIQKFIDKREMFIDCINNGDREQQHKDWIVNRIIVKVIDPKKEEIKELKELQKPIEVGLIL